MGRIFYAATVLHVCFLTCEMCRAVCVCVREERPRRRGGAVVGTVPRGKWLRLPHWVCVRFSLRVVCVPRVSLCFVCMCARVCLCVLFECVYVCVIRSVGWCSLVATFHILVWVMWAGTTRTTSHHGDRSPTPPRGSTPQSHTHRWASRLCALHLSCLLLCARRHTCANAPALVSHCWMITLPLAYAALRPLV